MQVYGSSPAQNTKGQRTTLTIYIQTAKYPQRQVGALSALCNHRVPERPPGGAARRGQDPIPSSSSSSISDSSSIFSSGNGGLPPVPFSSSCHGQRGHRRRGGR
jgi:hypothetical protein